jgi:hypothetical protein
MLPMVKAFVSVMVIFVPVAVTVAKLFPTLPRVMFPAVPVPEFVKLATPETVAAPV